MKMRRGINLGENNGMWKGDDVGYTALHLWVKRHLPKPELCQICNKVPSQDLSNISGKYLRDLFDWQWLCKRCHMIFDDRLTYFQKVRHNGREFIDMSNRLCLICNNNTTCNFSSGRPAWHYINNELACHNCYKRIKYREGRSKTVAPDLPSFGYRDQGMKI